MAGKFDKHDEHFENESYVVTSAVGHLVEIQAPEEFDVKNLESVQGDEGDREIAATIADT